MLAQLAKSYKSTADEKDGVIKQQTEGLDAILKSRWQDRQAYTANLSAADGRAKSLTAQADKLIALKVPQGDEVDQCRAARELLVTVLIEIGVATVRERMCQLVYTWCGDV